MADDLDQLEEGVGRRVIDALGRVWRPELHPRDRFGRFVSVLKKVTNLRVGQMRSMDDVVDDAPNINRAITTRTPRGFETRVDSRTGRYSFNVTPEQLAADPERFGDQLAAADIVDPHGVYPKCPHCNSPSAGGGYLPGHKLAETLSRARERGGRLTDVVRAVAQDISDTSAQGAVDLANAPTIADVIRISRGRAPQGRRIKRVPMSMREAAIGRARMEQRPMYVYADNRTGEVIGVTDEILIQGLDPDNALGNMVLRGVANPDGEYKSYNMRRPFVADQIAVPPGADPHDAIARLIRSDMRDRSRWRERDLFKTRDNKGESREISIQDAIRANDLALQELEPSEVVAGSPEVNDPVDAAVLGDRALRAKHLREQNERLAAAQAAQEEGRSVGVIERPREHAEAEIVSIEAVNEALEQRNAPGDAEQIQVNEARLIGLRAEADENFDIGDEEIQEVAARIAVLPPDDRQDALDALPHAVQDRIEHNLNSPSKMADFDRRVGAEVATRAADEVRQEMAAEVAQAIDRRDVQPNARLDIRDRPIGSASGFLDMAIRDVGTDEELQEIRDSLRVNEDAINNLELEIQDNLRVLDNEGLSRVRRNTLERENREKQDQIDELRAQNELYEPTVAALDRLIYNRGRVDQEDLEPDERRRIEAEILQDEEYVGAVNSRGVFMTEEELRNEFQDLDFDAAEEVVERLDYEIRDVAIGRIRGRFIGRLNDRQTVRLALEDELKRAEARFDERKKFASEQALEVDRQNIRNIKNRIDELNNELPLPDETVIRNGSVDALRKWVRDNDRWIAKARQNVNQRRRDGADDNEISRLNSIIESYEELKASTIADAARYQAISKVRSAVQKEFDNQKAARDLIDLQNNRARLRGAGKARIRPFKRRKGAREVDPDNLQFKKRISGQKYSITYDEDAGEWKIKPSDQYGNSEGIYVSSDGWFIIVDQKARGEGEGFLVFKKSGRGNTFSNEGLSKAETLDRKINGGQETLRAWESQFDSMPDGPDKDALEERINKQRLALKNLREERDGLGAGASVGEFSTIDRAISFVKADTAENAKRNRENRIRARGGEVIEPGELVTYLDAAEDDDDIINLRRQNIPSTDDPNRTPNGELRNALWEVERRKLDQLEEINRRLSEPDLRKRREDLNEKLADLDDVNDPAYQHYERQLDAVDRIIEERGRDVDTDQKALERRFQEVQSRITLYETRREAYEDDIDPVIDGKSIHEWRAERNELVDRINEFRDEDNQLRVLDVEMSDGLDDPEITENLDNSPQPEDIVRLDFGRQFDLGDDFLRWGPDERERTPFIDDVVEAARLEYANTPDAEKRDRPLFIYRTPDGQYFYSATHPRYYGNELNLDDLERIENLGDEKESLRQLKNRYESEKRDLNAQPDSSSKSEALREIDSAIAGVDRQIQSKDDEIERTRKRLNDRDLNRPRVLMAVVGDNKAIVYGANGLQRRDNVIVINNREYQNLRDADMDLVLSGRPNEHEMYDVAFKPNKREKTPGQQINELRRQLNNAQEANDTKKVKELENKIADHERRHGTIESPVRSTVHLGTAQFDPHQRKEELKARLAEIEAYDDDNLVHLPRERRKAAREKLYREADAARRELDLIESNEKERKEAEDDPEGFVNKANEDQAFRDKINEARALQQTHKDGKSTVQVYLNEKGEIEFDTKKWNKSKNRIATITKTGINWKNDDAKERFDNTGDTLRAKMQDMFYVDLANSDRENGQYQIVSRAMNRPFLGVVDGDPNAPENQRIMQPQIYNLRKIEEGDKTLWAVERGSEAGPGGFTPVGRTFLTRDDALAAIYSMEMQAVGDFESSLVRLPLGNDRRKWGVNIPKARLEVTPGEGVDFDGRVHVTHKFRRNKQTGALTPVYSVYRRANANDENERLEVVDYDNLQDAMNAAERRLDGDIPDYTEKITWELTDGDTRLGTSNYNGVQKSYEISKSPDGLYEYNGKRYATLDDAIANAETDEFRRRELANLDRDNEEDIPWTAIDRFEETRPPDLRVNDRELIASLEGHRDRLIEDDPIKNKREINGLNARINDAKNRLANRPDVDPPNKPQRSRVNSGVSAQRQSGLRTRSTKQKEDVAKAQGKKREGGVRSKATRNQYSDEIFDDVDDFDGLQRVLDEYGIYFDYETTGEKGRSFDKQVPIQIAAQRRLPDGTIEKKNWYMLPIDPDTGQLDEDFFRLWSENPDEHKRRYEFYWSKSLGASGMTPDQLKEVALDPREVYQQFAEFMRDDKNVVIAYNGSTFDFKYLDRALDQYAPDAKSRIVEYFDPYGITDKMRNEYERQFGAKNVQQGTIANLFDLDTSRAHTGDQDVENLMAIVPRVFEFARMQGRSFGELLGTRNRDNRTDFTPDEERQIQIDDKVDEILARAPESQFEQVEILPENTPDSPEVGEGLVDQIRSVDRKLDNVYTEMAGNPDEARLKELRGYADELVKNRRNLLETLTGKRSLSDDVVNNPDIDWSNERHVQLATLRKGDRDPKNNQQIKDIKWGENGPEISYYAEDRDDIAIRERKAEIAENPTSPAAVEERLQELNGRLAKAIDAGDDSAQAKIQKEIDQIVNQEFAELDPISGGGTGEVLTANTEIRGEDFVPGMRIEGKWHSEIPDAKSEEALDDILDSMSPSVEFDDYDDRGGLAFPSVSTAPNFAPPRSPSFQRGSDADNFASKPENVARLDVLDNAANQNLTPIRIGQSETPDSINAMFVGMMDQEFGAEVNLDNIVDMNQFLGIQSAKLRRDSGHLSLIMTLPDGSKITEYTGRRLSDNSYFNWMHRTLAYHGNGETANYLRPEQLKSVMRDLENGGSPDGPASIWLAHTGERVHSALMSRLGLTPRNSRFDGFIRLRQRGDRDELAAVADTDDYGVPHLSMSANWLAKNNKSEDPIGLMIHENLHAMSPASENPNEIMDILGFEEGLVEAYRGRVSPDIADQIGWRRKFGEPKLDTPINWWSSNSPYARWAHSYDAIQKMSGMSVDEFFQRLLTMDVRERENYLYAVANSLGNKKDRDRALELVLELKKSQGYWDPQTVAYRNIQSSGLD